MKDPTEFCAAVVSSCGLYRYKLQRTWGARGGAEVLWIMLNPSTADETHDDPTIRRCRNFSKAWGYDGMLVVNLYAYRTAHPRELRNAWLSGIDIVGPHSRLYLQDAAGDAALIVCAWGQRGPIPRVAFDMRRELYKSSPCALAYTKSGEPRHPLMLPKNLKPIPLI